MALREEMDQASERNIIPQVELKLSEYDLQRISKKHPTGNILITNVQSFQRLCKHQNQYFPKTYKDNFTLLGTKKHVVRGKIWWFYELYLSSINPNMLI